MPKGNTEVPAGVKENIIEGLYKGVPVSEGIAIAKAWVLESLWDEVFIHKIAENQIKIEIKRYSDAVREAEQQLVECRDRVKMEIGEEEAAIFDSHLAILHDPFFRSDVPKKIEANKINAEKVLQDALDEWIKHFSDMENEFFQFRMHDIKDVATRLLRALLKTEEIHPQADEPSILVSHILTPSETARIDRDTILGFVTEIGGKTSHASILARSMGIPAVVGVDRFLKYVKTGDMMIVDGNAGIVYVNPPESVLEGYRRRKKQFNAYWKRVCKGVILPSVTSDKVTIALEANIAITADISMAIQYKADGIGLFRTELPFLSAGRLLSEEEQFRIYHTVAESMQDQNVVIRTLDLGGDKFLPFEGIEQESNPFLGWRSIRISLQEIDVFKMQLRAILRASVYGRLTILFPMISSMEEITSIKKVLDECKSELRKLKVPFDENIKIGIMIEVPSAAIMAAELIKHVDMFSIGTNDLIQYALAVDRNNEKVARFYQPLNPAILRLVQMTVQSAVDAGKNVAMCGEMAGNPLYTGLLLGLGLRELSMSPLMLPEVKTRVRALSITECEDLAKEALKLDSAEAIENLLIRFHKKINARQTVPMLES